MRNFIRRLAAGGPLLLLAAILGVLTTGGVLLWLDGLEQDRQEERVATTSGSVAMVELVVASRDIEAGVALTDSMFELGEVPADVVLDGSFLSVDDVEGRVARYPIVKGEQILATRLVSLEDSEEDGAGLAFTVPPGMRAVSVPVSEVSGAGGLIVPGDRVDVMVSADFEDLFGPGEILADSSQKSDPVVMTILQDVLVLAVGQVLAERSDPDRDRDTFRNDDAEVQPAARSVTLAVSPKDAQLLFMSAQEGKLGLALRPFGEEFQRILDPVLKLTPADNLSGFLAAAQ
ncbi:MAG: Flp pilus assembly protein CpaB [Candidatus Hydrogenedentes bacterium]|nr:Flp pilus assembly protein CpaB [Candidatus Hydrogenedentota bacterium]